MDFKKAKEIIEIVQAYIDGKDIQYLNLDGNWVSTINPVFDFSDIKYRIKPEPRVFYGSIKDDPDSLTVFKSKNRSDHCRRTDERAIKFKEVLDE